MIMMISKTKHNDHKEQQEAYDIQSKVEELEGLINIEKSLQNQI